MKKTKRISAIAILLLMSFNSYASRYCLTYKDPATNHPVDFGIITNSRVGLMSVDGKRLDPFRCYSVSGITYSCGPLGNFRHVRDEKIFISYESPRGSSGPGAFVSVKGVSGVTDVNRLWAEEISCYKTDLFTR